MPLKYYQNLNYLFSNGCQILMLPGRNNQDFHITQIPFSLRQESQRGVLEMISQGDSYKELSDTALIRAIINGDQAAFVYLLVGCCSKRLKFLINDDRYREMKITLDELISEVLIILKKNDFHVLRLFRGFESDKTCTLKTYISVIANRFLSKKLKKFLQEKCQNCTQIGLCEFVVDNHNSNRHRELTNWDEFMVVLNPNEAEIFRAYKLDGKSVSEVARTFKTTETNIYTTCSRAISKLKKHFSGK
jgi:RNA polymerase sigma factor (sigma-70 family)